MQSGLDALSDSCALKLRDRCKDVHLQLASGSRSVNPFAKRHERHTKCVHLLEQHDEVSQIAAEAIKTPADEHIEAPSSGFGDQLIKGRPPVNVRRGLAQVPCMPACD